MGRLHRERAEDGGEDVRALDRGRAGPQAGGPAGGVRSLADLQRLAGNRAVASLLAARPELAGRQRRGPVQRYAAASDVEEVASDAAEAAEAPPTTEAPVTADAPFAEGEPDEGDEGEWTTTTTVPTSSFTTVGPPTNTTYSVSGSLRQAAETIAARKEAGSVAVTPDIQAADDGKRMRHAQVTVAQVIELPEWTDRGSATTNQQAEWDRFKTAITAHEDGHVALDVKAFAAAHKKILAKPTLAESDAEFDRIVTQAETDNDTYDFANDHGRKAGTEINPNIDEVTKVP